MGGAYPPPRGGRKLAAAVVLVLAIAATASAGEGSRANCAPKFVAFSLKLHGDQAHPAQDTSNVGRGLHRAQQIVRIKSAV